MYIPPNQRNFYCQNRIMNSEFSFHRVSLSRATRPSSKCSDFPDFYFVWKAEKVETINRCYCFQWLQFHDIYAFWGQNSRTLLVRVFFLCLSSLFFRRSLPRMPCSHFELHMKVHLLHGWTTTRNTVCIGIFESSEKMKRMPQKKKRELEHMHTDCGNMGGYKKWNYNYLIRNEFSWMMAIHSGLITYMVNWTFIGFCYYRENREVEKIQISQMINRFCRVASQEAAPHGTF